MRPPRRLLVFTVLVLLVGGWAVLWADMNNVLIGSVLQTSVLPMRDFTAPPADTAFVPLSPVLRRIGARGRLIRGEDAKLMEDISQSYPSLSAFLSDVHQLTAEPEESPGKQAAVPGGVLSAFLSDVRRLTGEPEEPSGKQAAVPRGMAVSLEDPLPGGILVETARFMVAESVLTDPAIHPKIRTVRRLALTDKTTWEDIRSEEHLPGQLLAGCSEEACAALERALGDDSVLPQSDGVRVARKVNDGLYVLQSSDPEARPEAMMADLAASGLFRHEDDYLEPNGVARLFSAIPSDPDFGGLWGMRNIGQNLPVSRSFDVPRGDGETDIGAPDAWDIWTGDRNALVCVIDTGINYTLPDLAENMWKNPGEIPGNNIDDDENGFTDDVHGYDFFNEDGDPMDDHGHGTHVAGTIGAVGDNGVGIAGVMWKANIMALKFLSAGGAGTLEDAVRAIGYATDMGCSLTNNSWGGGDFNQSLYDAIRDAGDKDALFIAAAGNSGRNSDERPQYPAAYDLPNIVSVAAIDAQGKLARFSNYGKVTIDLGAPGVQVMSFGKEGGYRWWNGTSMAAPHVAGVMGLIRSRRPDMSGAQVKERLLLAAAPTASLKDKTVANGRLNAAAALSFMDTPPGGQPAAGELCLTSTLQHRTRHGMTHEISSARLTITDSVTGDIVKDVTIPMDTENRPRLTDTSGIDGSKSYDLTLKPRGHLALTLGNVGDVFGSCHAMGEAKHGDYNESGTIDLSDLITAINYHVKRENSPHRELFEDIYRLSFGLADIVEVIRNYVETR